MAGARPHLVVFDAGGVILEVTGPWDAARQRAGVASTAAQSAETALAESSLAERHQRGEIETAAYFEQAAAVTGFTPSEVERIIDAWIGDEYPGWREVLDRLVAAHVTTALLSNTNAHHWRVMVPSDGAAGRYPAIGRLDHHLASHLIGAMKPDAVAFSAVEAATDVHGGDVLFFDDLPANVAGAQRFGWRAVLIDPTADPARQVLAVLAGVGI